MFEQSSEILEKELISVGSEMNAQFVGSESRDQAQSSFVKLYELKLREKEIESEKDSKKKEAKSRRNKARRNSSRTNSE